MGNPDSAGRGCSGNPDQLGEGALVALIQLGGCSSNPDSAGRECSSNPDSAGRGCSGNPDSAARLYGYNKVKSVTFIMLLNIELCFLSVLRFRLL